jgi:hypothetical protein
MLFQTPFDLLTCALPLLDKEHLSRTFSRKVTKYGTDPTLPIEDMFQCDFYSVVTSLLPITWTIDPEVGQYFYTDGRLDFYVYENEQPGWGIEFVVTSRNTTMKVSIRHVCDTMCCSSVSCLSVGSGFSDRTCSTV